MRICQKVLKNTIEMHYRQYLDYVCVDDKVIFEYLCKYDHFLEKAVFCVYFLKNQ